MLNKIIVYIRNLVVFALLFGFLCIVYFAVIKPLLMKSELELGMTQAQAMHSLGNPNKTLELPYPCDLDVLTDKECDKFMEKGTSSILYWRLAIDGMVVGGFNDQNKLVIIIAKKVP
jgi:hypothetical protein